MRQNSPILNVPAPVISLVAVFALIHAWRSMLGRDAAFEFLFRYAFIPARYGQAEAYPGGAGAEIWTVLSYAFLHGDLVHLSINVLWMVSFGSALAVRFGAVRFFVLFVLGSIAGAGAHFLVMPDDPAPLVGASAGVAALMAATLRFAFAPGGPLAGGRGRGDSYFVPAPSLAEALANQRVLAFVVLWFVLNFVFGAGDFSFSGSGGSIAWQAHIGGFLCGLLLFPVLDPVRAVRDNSPG
jgi:membrane associated rhomboid family serine protease